LKPRVLKLKGE